MAKYIIPDDIHAKIVERFITRRREGDKASEYAMKEFVARMKSTPPQISEDLARIILSTQKNTNSFILETNKIRNANDQKRKQLLRQQEAAKAKTHYGKIHNEFAKVGIHDVKDIHDTAQKTNPFIRYLAIKVMQGGSLRNLFVSLGLVALSINLSASAIYERFLSVAAVTRERAWLAKFFDNNKNIKKVATPAEAKPPGQPGSTPTDPAGPVKVEVIPFCGLGDPVSQKSMVELLQDGKSVTLRTKNGAVCLSLHTGPHRKHHHSKSHLRHMHPKPQLVP